MEKPKPPEKPPVKPPVEKPKPPKKKPKPPVKPVLPPVKSVEGEVIADKKVKGEKVVITVSNNSSEDIKDCEIVDEIPKGAKPKLDKKKGKLTEEGNALLKVGNIKSKEKKSVVYELKDAKETTLLLNLRFSSKNPIKAKFK